MKKIAGIISVIWLICAVFAIIISKPDICRAGKDYRPGETGRAFHDVITGFPEYYRTDSKPDFGQRFTETIYEKRVNVWFGPRCEIRAEAIKKCLHKVSVKVDKNFPDDSVFHAVKWAFHCLTAVVEEKHQPANYAEADKNFKDLWVRINDHWLKGNSGPDSSFQTSAFSVEIMASSSGEKNTLIMQLPGAYRVQRLKRLEKCQQELDEIYAKFPVLKKDVSFWEKFRLADLDSFERCMELRFEIHALSEEIRKEHEQIKK